MMSTIRTYKVPGSFQIINLFLKSCSQEELKWIFQRQEKLSPEMIISKFSPEISV
jgi:hypothetical protein